jgi:hypothetical protein
VNARLNGAEPAEVMLAALAGQDVLAADETPVNALGGRGPAPAREDGADPGEKDGTAGAPHVLITRTRTGG